jgi:hypothetical protein
VQARVEGVRQMLAAANHLFAPTLPGLFAGDPPAEVVPLLEAMAADVRPESMRTALLVMAEADRIAVPTLLIWVELDARSPVGVAHQFQNAVPDEEGPRQKPRTRVGIDSGSPLRGSPPSTPTRVSTRYRGGEFL